MKLVSKEQVGHKYRKRYDKARPPFLGALEYDKVSDDCKAKILALKKATSLMVQQGLLNRAIDSLLAIADTF
jgi:hypothetical protein